MKELLFQIHSNINDPDSVFGTQRNETVESAAPLLIHQQQWMACAGVYVV